MDTVVNQQLPLSVVNEGLDCILTHFEIPRWPRRISTKLTEGKQVLVYNKEEAYARFKQVNFLDCRINAYPAYTEYEGINRQPPNFIFVDIDRSNFKTQRTFDLAVSQTLKSFGEKLPGGYPTVLDTGNGYHFYQPIQAMVLEQEEIFTKLHSEPSKAFLRFAAQFLSGNRSDPTHNPSLKSCLIRIPGSINTKFDEHKQVQIIQKWDGTRPAINYLLRDFKKYLIQKKIDQQYQKQSRNASRPNRSGCAAGANTTISWIESNILQGEGISDYRKITIDLVLASYLLNIKKYDYNTAYDTGKRRLTFNVNYKIRSALNRAQNGPVLYPMRLETMKSKYPEMYKKVLLLND
jgi:hypothetical protein